MDQQDMKGPGLHKEVSTIFEGVPLPDGGGPESAGPAGPEVRSAGTLTAAQAIAGINGDTSETPKPNSVSPSVIPERPRGMVKPISRRTDFLNNLLAKVLPADLDDSTARRQKVMALLIPVLAIILVLVFVKVLGTPARSDGGVGHGSESTSAVESETGETPKKDVNWELPAVISKSVRDPMKSKSFGSAGPSEGGSPVTASTTVTGADDQRAAELKNLEVTGILYTKDRPAAIVGTRIVHEGDTVLGAVVVKINEDSIELELDGRKWTQSMHP